ncbi:MAG: hypothetical protein A3G24_25350 [Betaproteobacteria bacterium RIFCSPLOWO2_12_FULL_62_13]|nr:MAG: hypothetical protein A3G24_25350 [Betaproteobacteria bacterium RIFCSPLOWO2_12_FULL_62_13]
MTHHLSVYRVLAVAGVLAINSFGAAVGATSPSAFPERPIRVVLGFPPGGGSDAVARIISPKLYEDLGQQMVVDNRPGAGGNIATEIVTQANPDGYTVLLGFSTTLTANPMLYKLKYDVARDLQPVINLVEGQYVLVLHPSVPAKSLKEFIDLAKAKPGTLNYASSGIGSASHLVTELFKARTGVNIVHVAYKGGGPATTAQLGGEVEVQFASLPSSIPYVKAGKLRALAVSGPKRAATAPDIRTIAELGFPGFEMSSWYGLLVPAKTPSRIVNILYEAVRKALQLADVREQYLRLGLEIAVKDPKQFAAQIKAETKIWAKVIETTGIQVR